MVIDFKTTGKKQTGCDKKNVFLEYLLFLYGTKSVDLPRITTSMR